MNGYLTFAIVAYAFQLFSTLAVFTAAAAALYCAVQVRKLLEELRAQTAALRRLAGEADVAGPGETEE